MHYSKSAKLFGRGHFPLLALSTIIASALLIVNIHLGLAEQLLTALISALFFETISLSHTNCSKIPIHHNISGEISAVCIVLYSCTLMFPNTSILVLICFYAFSSFAVSKLLKPTASIFSGFLIHSMCIIFILLTSSLFRTDLPLQLFSGDYITPALMVIPACLFFAAMHFISTFNILSYQTQDSAYSRYLSALISSFFIIRPVLIFILFITNGFISPPIFIYNSSISNRILSFLIVFSFFLIVPIARYTHAGIITAAASTLLCYIVYIFYQNRLVPNDHSSRSFIFEIRKKYS